ncbi:hypothetical protein SE17_03845 [Kouleothrix aurantiaca]|uniref:Uncharacterized protein n=1 Tax=Kouleothrix aurantiaca TaxID=186479 RepID=A0A0P9DLN6_9CHLR|nr:hypothetical protein SE17_03840 [Kouleothrix aurantiaca]KPV54424.1 hypothetical protein SE17_03845 [Kouleothrix aurantiaca]
MDAVLWLRQDLRSLLKRLYQPIARLRRSKTPASTPKAPSIRALSFAEIGTMISIDRRAFGYLLADFSMTLIQPHDATRRALLIPGTLTNYPELCDELELRLRRPRRFFSVEIIRSVWGLCFLATLLYALVLVLLGVPILPVLLWLGAIVWSFLLAAAMSEELFGWRGGQLIAGALIPVVLQLLTLLVYLFISR